MTNEERDKAIRILQWLHDNKFLFASTEEDVKYATENAIEALEQEPSGDVISRQAVIYYIKGHIHEIITESGADKNAHTNSILRALINGVETMPPVNPQEPCSNCCNGNQIEKAKLCQKSYLAGMEHPQEPKTGHWIDMDEGFSPCECSECKSVEFIKSKYCPNCGAKMIEDQERSNKG